MGYANYKDVKTAIASAEPFNHGYSMTGTRFVDEYVVRSYETPILILNLTTGAYWLNEGHYSQVTARQQNITRRAIVANPRRYSLRVERSAIETLREERRAELAALRAEIDIA